MSTKTQEELIRSIINSLEKIPPLNKMQNDVNILKEKSILMVGASSSESGKSGFVPAPQSSDHNKFLRGDGTWQTVVTEGAGNVSIENVGSTEPVISGDILFTNTGDSEVVQTLYKTDLLRLIGDPDNSRAMFLSIGNAGTSYNVTSGIRLVGSKYNFTLVPPEHPYGSMRYYLPRYLGIPSDVEIASVEYMASIHYSKTESDQKYLNKTASDTAVSIAVHGAGDGYGGLRFLQPDGKDGNSLIMRNDGSAFHALISNSATGGWITPSIGIPLTINLSTGVCNINGNANSANNDRLGNLIDGTYAKLDSDVRFTQLQLLNSSSNNVATISTNSYATIISNKLVKTTANVSSGDAGYYFRNISSGTSATPASTGVTHGSIYIQYTT